MVVDEAAILRGAEVLYVIGDHTSVDMKLLEELNVAGLTLVVLNMCRTYKLGKQMSGKGAHFVSCWSTMIPDKLAVDFGITMMERLSVSAVSEAFEHAKALVPVGERPPVLINAGRS